MAETQPKAAVKRQEEIQALKFRSKCTTQEIKDSGWEQLNI